MRLGRTFFEQPTLIVAQQILGQVLCFNGMQGTIVETEAYIGHDDPACHAAQGKTPRNAVMFGKAGYSYVYFIYGMYFCLNIVTEKEGFPAAVLIRGLRVGDMLLNGPGKLCRYLTITKEHNAIDLTCSENFYVRKGNVVSYERTPRIGISKGQDKLWRFIVRPL